jgi:hypothetical protein
MIYGLDLLGVARYGKVAAANWPNGFALGAFSNTFGDALPAVRQIIETGRCPRVRLHLDWQDSHRYESRFDEIRREAQRVAKFIARYKLIDWRISGACEHLLGRGQAEVLRDIVLNEIPGVIYVNTPMTGGARLPVGDQCINESHGHLIKSSRLDFSFDGQNAFDANVEVIKSKFAHCETFYLWSPRCNLKYGMNDTTPRSSRNAVPDKNVLKAMIYLTQEKGITKLPTRWISKSNAENHGPGDVKGDKLVIISPVKGAAIRLVAKNGKLVDTLPFYGSYDGSGPGMWRYYSRYWGFQLSEKAMRLSGSPLVSVMVGDRKYGVINPAFRHGSYR